MFNGRHQQNMNELRKAKEELIQCKIATEWCQNSVTADILSDS